MNELKQSQNFLSDKILLEQLIKHADFNLNDNILEIGTGTGIITQLLCKNVRHVIGVEYDEKMFRIAKKRLSIFNNLTLLNEDFLNYQMPEFSYKIFANIPYNITSQIIQKILTADNSPLKSYLILQKEPAMKYSGLPYRTETMQSILWKPFFEFDIIQQIPKESFTPIPNVESVLLKIQKKEKPFINQTFKSDYFDFVVHIFNQKGNMKKRLSNIFSYNQMKRLAKDNLFKLDDSIIDLNLKQFINIYHYYQTGVIMNKKLVVLENYNNWSVQQNSI